MIAADGDGDGLIEYPGTGNFGERPRRRDGRPIGGTRSTSATEDAFSNALAYRAATMFGRSRAPAGARRRRRPLRFQCRQAPPNL